MKKGANAPLFDFVSSLEGDRKLRTDGSRCGPPAARSQRCNGRLTQLLIIGQVLAIDCEAIAIIRPQVADTAAEVKAFEGDCALMLCFTVDQKIPSEEYYIDGVGEGRCALPNPALLR